MTSDSPRNLRCPSCGYTAGSPIRPRTAPVAAPPPANAPPPQAPAMPPAYQAGYGVYGAPPVQAPPPGYGYPQPYAMPPPKKLPAPSIAGMIVGIVSMCMVFFSAIPFIGILGAVGSVAAIVLGSLGLAAANKDPVNVGGRGMAITALVLGIIAVIIYAFILIMVAIFSRNFNPVV